MTGNKTESPQDAEWAIGPNCWGLKMCGILRNENSYWHNVLANLLVPLYAIILTTAGLLPQTFALFKVWGDIQLMAENLVTNLMIIMTLPKILTMWYKKEVIVTMVNVIRDDWSKMMSEEEREVMIKYGQVSRMITLGAFLAGSTGMLVYVLPVLFGTVLRTRSNITDTGDRPMILQSVYFYDAYKTPSYELTIISQIMACVLTALCYMGVGALLSVIVLHVCSQLENLGINLECMLKSDQRSRKNFETFFSSTVKEHIRLIRFADLIENTFSMTLLMIGPAFTIAFCLQGFQLIDAVKSEIKGAILQVVFSVVYMICIAFVIFVYSLVGQVLADQSEKIQHAAYNCEWYELPPKEAAMLMPIVIRAQRPLQITAGKFVPLSMNTFATLMKTSAGYLSCLLAVHE